jgi:hypothetical protein
LAIEVYEAAELAVTETVGKCRAVLEHLSNGLITPEEAEGWVNELVLSMLEALDDAFTSSPDPRDDPGGLVHRAGEAANEIERLFDEHPGLLLRTPSGVAGARGFLASRVDHADEVVRLVAVIAAWEDTAPALAPLRVRRRATETLDQAARMRLRGGVLERMVRAGVRAFGPRWTVNLAGTYLDRHVEDEAYWGLVLVAMDELSAWAAATELHGVPPEFQRRAISALIEIAGHPELTQWAVSRIPLHRVTRADRRELAELLQDWYEVMPVDWISEAQQDGTVSIEVTYLRALEEADASWPGDPRREG